MNNDELFRKALQRQNDRAAGMKMPHDMEQRVMNRIKSENKSRRWLRPASIVAIAASLLALLALYFTSKDTEPKEMPLTAQQTEQRDSKRSEGEKPAISEEQLQSTMIDAGQGQAPSRVDGQLVVSAQEKPVVAQNTQERHDTAIKSQPAIRSKSAPAAYTADQLSDYIARLEAEMEALDDSVRSTHLEKIIAADFRLQQLVNRIVKGDAERAMNELQKDSTANYINF